MKGDILTVVVLRGLGWKKSDTSLYPIATLDPHAREQSQSSSEFHRMNDCRLVSDCRHSASLRL